jgi:hypothetical protein
MKINGDRGIGIEKCHMLEGSASVLKHSLANSAVGLLTCLWSFDSGNNVRRRRYLDKEKMSRGSSKQLPNPPTEA